MTISQDAAPGRPLLITGSLHPELDAELSSRLASIKLSDPLAEIWIVAGSQVSAFDLETRLATADHNLFNVHFLTLSRAEERLARSGTFAGLNRVNKVAGSELALTLAILAKDKSRSERFGEAAELPGFARVLARSLSDLDEAGIDSLEAFHPVLSRRMGEARARALADLRISYLRLLENHSAPLPATKNSPEVPSGTDKSIIIYGLYDFNALQFDFLNRLIQAFPVTLYIPSSGQTSSSPAYEFSHRTIKRVAALHRINPVVASSPRIFNSRLFDYEKLDSVPVHPTAEVKMFSAADPASEAEIVAGRIAELICHGDAMPSRIGVILWRPELYRPLILDALGKAGIPRCDAIGLSLAETSAGKGLLGLLSLGDGNIRRRELMDLLQCDGLNLPELNAPNGLALIEAASVKSGIIEGGKALWERSLAEFAADEARNNPESPLIGASESLKQFVIDLFDALDSLCDAGDIASSIDAFLQLAARFLSPTPFKQVILSQLEGLKALSPEITGLELFDLMQVIGANLASISVERDAARGQGVMLLTPLLARGVRFDHLFMIGMTQSAVPLPPREDPLLPDDVRRGINRMVGREDSFPLNIKSDRSDEERQLFAMAIESACETITLSYPGHGIGGGSEAFPSGFLFELCRLMTGTAVTSDELSSLPFFDDLRDGDTLPGWEKRLLEPQSYPLMQLLRLPERAKYLRINQLYSSQSIFFDRLRLSARGRRRDDQWSPFEGMVGISETARIDTPIAVTTLERWAHCPFQSWIERCLSLEEWEEPELALELPALVAGKIIHELLEKLYLQAQATGRIPLGSNDREWAAASIRETAEISRRKFHSFCSAPDGVWRIAENILIQRVVASLDDLITLEGDYRFDRSEEKVSGTIDLSNHNLDLKGRIDRLDRTADGKGLRVVDYKSGKVSSPEKLNGGNLLQLPIYLRLLVDSSPGVDIARCRASYFQVRGNGSVREYTLEGKWIEDNRVRIDHSLDVLSSGLDSGYFPPLPTSPGDCQFCPAITACDVRSRKAAPFRKEDSRLIPLLELREDK